MKPGFKTSEFFIVIVSQIIGALVLMGKLTPDSATQIQTVAESAVRAVLDAATALYMLYTAVEYIKGRTSLKAQEVPAVKPLTLSNFASDPKSV